MQIHWDDTQPIYLQLRDRMLNMILEGAIAEGEALPSVRNISAEYQLNPITVSKAYQLLVDNELAEKRRGLGMFVTIGAKNKLLAAEREQFLSVEWPALLEKIERLGLSLEDLVKGVDDADHKYKDPQHNDLSEENNEGREHNND
ncbi:GntR family transcriptional regulator [Kangiella sp. TOML190]|uniref:GntR family transcriptional regulator n=1 Tax=Kangiella sp. TOML190 TaxID=2931351 RepID=UPI00203BB4D6|nr:GntR family transcriptional regulator [Kangiella sp. TOML190]